MINKFVKSLKALMFCLVCVVIATSCASEQTFDPEITVVTTPYLIADTVMSVKDNALKCKLIIKKVTPQGINGNDTTKVAQRSLTVAQMGFPGDNELLVLSNEMTSNTHTESEVTETDGNYNDFFWTEKKVTHSFRAEWNHNHLKVGHSDNIIVYSTDFVYASGEKMFKFDFKTELKVVQNDVIYDASRSSDPNYLGTRILTIEGWCNGKKFTSSTGKITLKQHD